MVCVWLCASLIPVASLIRPTMELPVLPFPSSEVFLSLDLYPLTRICSKAGPTRKTTVKGGPRLEQSSRPLLHHPREYLAVFLRNRILLDTREIYRRSRHPLRQAVAPAMLPLHAHITTLPMHSDLTLLFLPAPRRPAPHTGRSLQSSRKASWSQKHQTPVKDSNGNVVLSRPYFPYHSLVIHHLLSIHACPIPVICAIPKCRERPPSCACFQGCLRIHTTHTGSFAALQYPFSVVSSPTLIIVNVSYLHLNISCQIDRYVQGNAESRVKSNADDLADLHPK